MKNEKRSQCTTQGNDIGAWSHPTWAKNLYCLVMDNIGKHGRNHSHETQPINGF